MKRDMLNRLTSKGVNESNTGHLVNPPGAQQGMSIFDRLCLESVLQYEIAVGSDDSIYASSGIDIFGVEPAKGHSAQASCQVVGPQGSRSARY